MTLSRSGCGACSLSLSGTRARLVLARDPFGIKPLYYRVAEGGLLRLGARALPRGEIDFDALEAFLAFNSIPGPYSIFRDVKKLLPGHLLVWQDGEARVSRFARPTPAAAAEVRSEDENEPSPRASRAAP